MRGGDRLSKERRSWNMAQIRGKNTRPERIVRGMLHRMGYRFRLHGRDLPGRPDIVLAKHRTVVFVHGCFWHRHRGCRISGLPKTRREWWRTKLEGNALRDRKNRRALQRDGWRVIIVWGCEIKNPEIVAARLGGMLSPGAAKCLGLGARLRLIGNCFLRARLYSTLRG
jgi:DNA mismatch endonuclease, patch repair protein